MSGISLAPGERDVFKIVQAVVQLLQGRSNATGTFTLTAGATSTTVAAPNCNDTSFVWLSPITAHAANDMATTSTVAGRGQFVVTHANNARLDRTFGYVTLG